MATQRVLSVGQCVLDHRRIAAEIERRFDAHVVPAATAQAAFDLLSREPFHLVMVNRILDSDASSGIDLIRKMKSDNHFGSIPVMLISNYPDQQQQAELAGAVKGFGKSQIDSAIVESVLSPYLAYV